MNPRQTVLLFFLLLGGSCRAQEPVTYDNFNFDIVGDAIGSPAHWQVHGNGHTISLDQYEKYEGTASLSITSKPNRLVADSMAMVVRRIDLAPGGKTAVLSGFLKLEGVTGVVGLVLVANDKSSSLVADDMRDRNLNGSLPWQSFSVTLTLPENTESLGVAVYQVGDGRVWADQLQLFIDGQEISSASQAGVQSAAARFAARFGDVTGTDESWAHLRMDVSAPPAGFGLQPFYKKFLSASGIPIIGSGNVSDEALYSAKATFDMMLKGIPEVRRAMIRNNARVAIIGKDERMTDLPEYSDWDDSINQRARGTGGWMDFPITSCGEENVLCLPGDRYQGEDILIHEFAHAIHMLGIARVDPAFDEKLRDAYHKAMAEGLWKDTYAITSFTEYFAEGVQSYYDVNQAAASANGIHNEIYHHDKLKSYDPRLYELISSYLVYGADNVSCHVKER